MLISATTWKHLELTLNYTKLTEIAAKLVSDFQLNIKKSFGIAFGV